MRLLRPTLLILAGAAALALGAQVSVPMVPIPTTLQTLAVVAFGLFAGPRLAALAAFVYLLLVVAGLPVLSRGQQFGGWEFVNYLGAGYVVGFVPGAAVAGWLGYGGRFRRMVVAGLASHGVVLALGVAVMTFWLGPGRAIEHGLLPFLPGAVAKSLLAAALIMVVRQVERTEGHGIE
jgi:biotin transport system substrate-specific component